MIIMSVEWSPQKGCCGYGSQFDTSTNCEKRCKNLLHMYRTLVTLESNGAFLWKGRESFMICTVVIIHAVLPNPYEHLSLPGI